MAARLRIAVPALLAAALALGACGRAGPSVAGGAPPSAPTPAASASTPSPAWTSAPRSSSGSWQTGTAGTKRTHPAKATGLWSGAGRHPQWRGCRHTYDPSLSAFIFGTPTSG